MKKYLVFPLAMLVFALGCNDDPVTRVPGDMDDPAFTTFQEEFDGIAVTAGKLASSPLLRQA